MTDSDKKAKRRHILKVYASAIDHRRKAMLRAIWIAKQEFNEKAQRLQAARGRALEALDRDAGLRGMAGLP
jgi:hypothetical protein